MLSLQLANAGSANWATGISLVKKHWNGFADQWTDRRQLPALVRCETGLNDNSPYNPKNHRQPMLVHSPCNTLTIYYHFTTFSSPGLRLIKIYCTVKFSFLVTFVPELKVKLHTRMLHQRAYTTSVFCMKLSESHSGVISYKTRFYMR